MSNPFDDVKNALAGLGIDPLIAGFILGSALLVFFVIVIPWVIDPHSKDKSGNTLFIAAIIGTGIATGVGWFPIWFVFVILVGLLWMILDPMGSKVKSG